MSLRDHKTAFIYGRVAESDKSRHCVCGWTVLGAGLCCISASHAPYAAPREKETGQSEPISADHVKRSSSETAGGVTRLG